MAKTSHVVDRIVMKVLADNESDLLGGPILSAIGRLAAEEVREGIRLRKQRGQAIDGQLAEVDRMPNAALARLCAERADALCH